MVIASWLIAVDPDQVRAARESLRAVGRELPSKKSSRWIVLLTQSTTAVEDLRRELLATPGVQTAMPVASFDDTDAHQNLVRW